MKQFIVWYNGQHVGSVFADSVHVDQWPDHPGWSTVHAIARGETIFAGESGPRSALRLEEVAPRANARHEQPTAEAEESHNATEERKD